MQHTTVHCGYCSNPQELIEHHSELCTMQTLTLAHNVYSCGPHILGHPLQVSIAS